MKKNAVPSCANVLCSIVLALACGCSSPTTGAVAGKITYQGKPLTGGMVTLVTATGLKITSPINPDGSYRAREVPLGPAKIAVESKGASGLPPVLVPRVPANVRVPGATAPGTAIEPRYADADKSGLTCQVSGGAQTHDIDLP